jgi:hypothetical protein
MIASSLSLRSSDVRYRSLPPSLLRWRPTPSVHEGVERADQPALVVDQVGAA